MKHLIISSLFLFVVLLSSSSINAQTANAYYSQGYNYTVKGDKQAAIQSYTKAIELDANYKKAYAERGILYNNQGKKELALNDFTTALNIDPNYDYARRNRAAIYMEEAMFDKAVKDYDILIEQDPQFSFYYDLRGVANYKIGKKEAALADFNKALEINPDNEEVQVKKAKLLLELGKDYEAYDMLSGTDYSKEKLSNEAKLQLGRSSRKTGEYERALTYLIPLENTGFKPEYVYLELGFSYLHLDQYDNAINAFQKCLDVNPNNETAQINKASAESQSGNYEMAIETYSGLLANSPNNNRALNGRAIAYYALKKADLACGDWKNSAESGDKNAQNYIDEYCSEEALKLLYQQTGTSENNDETQMKETEEVEDEPGKVEESIEKDAYVEEELEEMTEKSEVVEKEKSAKKKKKDKVKKKENEQED